jgi:hypothetical protein
MSVRPGGRSVSGEEIWFAGQRLASLSTPQDVPRAAHNVWVGRLRRLSKIWQVASQEMATAVVGRCTTAPTTGSRPSSAMSMGSGVSSLSVAAPSPTSSTTGAAIHLRCSSGATNLATPSGSAPVLLGLMSELWGRSDVLRAIDLTSVGPSYRGSTLVKSVLYATKAANAGTRIRVQSPATAALFYTTWGEWGSADLTGMSMVTGARREVTVGGCGAATAGFPGGIVVEGPSCVTLVVTSADGRHHRDLTLPIGRGCPPG